MRKSDSTFRAVPSKDGEIVAVVSKCGSRGLDLIFPVQYLRAIPKTDDNGNAMLKRFLSKLCNKENG